MELEQALWGTTIRTAERDYECLISVKDNATWLTISTDLHKTGHVETIYSLRLANRDPRTLSAWWFDHCVSTIAFHESL